MMGSMGYDLTSGPGLNFSKGERYFNLLCRKEKPLIIITGLAGGWAMYQLRSHQPLTLESHWAMIAHRARPRGNQVLVSATSSENFQ